ncbi:MAG TPA: iron-containing alcohol dehydrogenase [Bacilli bacterium]|nr:iron-containing alcohol dehydrogenase [Bacilli bacterium]
MNPFLKMYYRVYQFVFYLASFVLNFKEPKIIKGPGSIKEIAPILRKKRITRVLLVTDQGLYKLKLHDPVVEALKLGGIDSVTYHDTVANPTIDNIERALEQFDEFKAEAIIAFGGGSAIDCAKGVAVRATNRKKTIPMLKGVLKVHHRKKFLIAIPTTAGTGSEATVAAVVTNPKTHEKYAINDPKLIPDYAVLDPDFLVKLPGNVTSTTGMDALTHAVESYTNYFQVKKSRCLAKEAVKLIFDNLELSYKDPTNIVARENMQMASYYAGVAFTRGYVGNVHAVAHTLGGFYGVPHGLANAVILPHVLRYYGDKVARRLAELADAAGITTEAMSHQQKAKLFIEAIDGLNQRMNIPARFQGIVKAEDISLMVERAYHEANPLYPVPKIFSRQDFVNIYHQIQD